MNLKQAIKTIEESGEYELLRRFYPIDQYHQLPDDDSTMIGCVIDCETTGLNTQKDLPIEIGALFFQYNPKSGEIGKVLHKISAFEDPGIEIPPEITDLTGITQDMVENQVFPDKDFNAWMHMTSLVIAHNASFDRQVLERRLPILERKNWACSIENIPWEEEGIRHRGLEMLALYFRYFFEAHRAIYDSEFLLHILTQKLPRSNQLVFKALLDNARTPSVKIWATGSSFDSKDALKTYGFQWSPGEHGMMKGWYIIVPKDKESEVLNFLKSDAFTGECITPTIDNISPKTRFSIRS